MWTWGESAEVPSRSQPGGSSSLRGRPGSTATSPPATRDHTASDCADWTGVNRRNWAGSAAAIVSVRPFADNAASDSGIAAATPRTAATLDRTAAGIGWLLVISTSAVSSDLVSGPGSATANAAGSSAGTAVGDPLAEGATGVADGAVAPVPAADGDGICAEGSVEDPDGDTGAGTALVVAAGPGSAAVSPGPPQPTSGRQASAASSTPARDRSRIRIPPRPLVSSPAGLSAGRSLPGSPGRASVEHVSPDVPPVSPAQTPDGKDPPNRGRPVTCGAHPSGGRAASNHRHVRHRTARSPPRTRRRRHLRAARR